MALFFSDSSRHSKFKQSQRFTGCSSCIIHQSYTLLIHVARTSSCERSGKFVNLGGVKLPTCSHLAALDKFVQDSSYFFHVRTCLLVPHRRAFFQASCCAEFWVLLLHAGAVPPTTDWCLLSGVGITCPPYTCFFFVWQFISVGYPYLFYGRNVERRNVGTYR